MRITTLPVYPHRDVLVAQRTVLPVGATEAPARLRADAELNVWQHARAERVVEGELLERSGSSERIWEETRRASTRSGRIFDAGTDATARNGHAALQAYGQHNSEAITPHDRIGALFSAKV